jgi:hypothetical protein
MYEMAAAETTHGRHVAESEGPQNRSVLQKQLQIATAKIRERRLTPRHRLC